MTGDRGILKDRRLLHAYCPNRSIDGSDSAQAVRRDRAHRPLAGRGTGGARARRHAVRQRRLANLGEAPAVLAARAATRWLDPRPVLATHRDAGTCAAAGRRVRCPAFPSRLFPLLIVLAPADA